MSNLDFTVLYVDDELNQNNAKIMRLKTEGFKITTVDNAKDALKILQSEQYDILMTDYFMPIMTGEDLIRETRSFNKKIFVILQTAYSSEKPEKQMMDELEINAYYDKGQPIDSLLMLLKLATRTITYLRENENLAQQNIKLDTDLTETKKLVERLEKDKELLLEREQMANLGEISRRIADTILWPCSAFDYTINTIIENYEKYDGMNEKNYEYIKNETLEAIKFSKIHVNQLKDIGKAILDQTERVKNSVKERYSITKLIYNFRKFINEGNNKYSVGVKINEEKIDEHMKTVLIDGDYSNMLFILTKLFEGIAKSCCSSYTEIQYYTSANEYINLDINIVEDKNVELIMEYEGKGDPDMSIVEKDLLEERLTHGKDKDTGIYFELALFSVKRLVQQLNGTIVTGKQDKKVKVVLSIPIIF